MYKGVTVIFFVIVRDKNLQASSLGNRRSTVLVLEL